MLIGNVTRDPETRTTPNGQTVCSFGVATNRTWNDASGQKQKQAEFHNIVAWGKLAEICGQYVNKGRKIYVEGRLQTHEWEAQDGARKQRTEIISDNVILLDRAPGGEAGRTNSFGNSANVNETLTIAPSEPVASPAPAPDDGIKVENIPF